MSALMTPMAASDSGARSAVLLAVLALLITTLQYALFADGLSHMVSEWGTAEYSHGWLIPVVALYMVWQRRQALYDALSPVTGQRVALGAWWGAPALIVGVLVAMAGELATLATLVEYGFLLTLWALVCLVVGLRGWWVLAPALIYLGFMIPLPNLVYQNLSALLQLWSSQLGVFLLRGMGVSVYLSGNVIDLGTYQLQVAEACSGLRYLFPLLSFGYLVACFYQRSWWLKSILLLSVLPITLLMNSLRIALIGLSVEHWGIEMAQGVLHSFEGWVVFIGCLLFLSLEIYVVERLLFRNPQPFKRLDLTSVPVRQSQPFQWATRLSPALWPLALTAGLLLLMLPLKWTLHGREEIVLERPAFNSFPLFHQGWLGRESPFSADVLELLQVSDYLNVEYDRLDGGGVPVNLYVAWYDSQRRGTSIHSPQTCLPADGWEIQRMEKASLASLLQGSPAEATQNDSIRRVIIQKGRSRQLVFYWFNQRGRIFSDQYLAKWYLFQDSLMLNRTDGALIRVLTPILEMETEQDAERRLRGFLKDFGGLWDRWIPGLNPREGEPTP